MVEETLMPHKWDVDRRVPLVLIVTFILTIFAQSQA